MAVCANALPATRSEQASVSTQVRRRNPIPSDVFMDWPPFRRVHAEGREVALHCTSGDTRDGETRLGVASQEDGSGNDGGTRLPVG